MYYTTTSRGPRFVRLILLITRLPFHYLHLTLSHQDLQLCLQGRILRFLPLKELSLIRRQPRVLVELPLDVCKGFLLTDTLRGQLLQESCQLRVEHVNLPALIVNRVGLEANLVTVARYDGVEARVSGGLNVLGLSAGIPRRDQRFYNVYAPLNPKIRGGAGRTVGSAVHDIVFVRAALEAYRARLQVMYQTELIQVGG